MILKGIKLKEKPCDIDDSGYIERNREKINSVRVVKNKEGIVKCYGGAGIEFKLNLLDVLKVIPYTKKIAGIIKKTDLIEAQAEIDYDLDVRLDYVYDDKAYYPGFNNDVCEDLKNIAVSPGSGAELRVLLTGEKWFAKIEEYQNLFGSDSPFEEFEEWLYELYQNYIYDTFKDKAFGLIISQDYKHIVDSDENGKYIELNMTLGIGGMVFNKNNEEEWEPIAFLPTIIPYVNEEETFTFKFYLNDLFQY